MPSSLTLLVNSLDQPEHPGSACLTAQRCVKNRPPGPWVERRRVLDADTYKHPQECKDNNQVV